MKYFSRLGLYKASNVTFNPNNLEAYSYDWWRFVEKRGQLVVLNNYGYSSSTIKHIYKVRRLLEDLGIQVHATIEAPRGLQDLDSSISLYQHRIEQLKNEIAKPKTHAKKNLERKQAIKELETKIKQVKALKRMK